MREVGLAKGYGAGATHSKELFLSRTASSTLDVNLNNEEADIKLMQENDVENRTPVVGFTGHVPGMHVYLFFSFCLLVSAAANPSLSSRTR
jgi:hypothetical protein